MTVPVDFGVTSIPDAVYFEEGDDKTLESCKPRFASPCFSAVIGGDLYVPGKPVRAVWFEGERIYVAPKTCTEDAIGDVASTIRLFEIMRAALQRPDPNAEMIRRDGPAKPKPLAIPAPTSQDQPSSAPGLMVVAGLGQRWPY